MPSTSVTQCRFFSPSSIPRKNWESHAELALVLLCCVIFWKMAKALGPDLATGPMLATWLEDLPTDLAARTRWLNGHAGPAMVIVALAGWGTLLVSRQPEPLVIRLLVMVALWSLTGYVVAGGVGRGGLAGGNLVNIYLICAMTCLLLALLLAYLYRQCHKTMGVRYRAAPNWWVYPGWLLFGGLGNLWLLDFSARGYAKYFNLGVYQFDGWLLSTMILTVCAASLPNLLVWVGLVLAPLEAQKYGSIPIIVLVLLTWIGGIVLLAKIADSPQHHVAFFTEVLRLPVWFGMAWLTYRWVSNGLRPISGMLAGVLLLAALVLALWITDDRGPILAQAIAMSLVLGSMAAVPIWQRHSSAWGVVIAVLLSSLLLSAIAWGVYRYAPAERLAALAHPHFGELEFLSEIRWFLHAAPRDGFGLGQVPWCGNAAALGIAKCGGVPRQIQSDYVYAALVGVWGYPRATLLIVLLLTWLTSLVSIRFGRASARAVDLDNLAGWLIAGGATTYATQTIISSMGTLGVMPLTGVSIPILAYGSTSLLTLGFLAGMAVNPMAKPCR